VVCKLFSSKWQTCLHASLLRENSLQVVALHTLKIVLHSNLAAPLDYKNVTFRVETALFGPKTPFRAFSQRCEFTAKSKTCYALRGMGDLCAVIFAALSCWFWRAVTVMTCWRVGVLCLVFKQIGPCARRQENGVDLPGALW